MKKLIALLLVLAMALSLVACGGGSAGKTNEPVVNPETGKTVLNIWAFTDEVPNMINRFMELHPEFAEKYELKVTIIATTDGLYQPALDQALAGGGADAPDLYTAEAAFVMKYTQGDAAKYAAP